MNLADRFQAAIDVRAHRTVADLTPTAMAQAAADVLGVPGVGITLVDTEVRLPLAASNAAVVMAERIQATLGDGPCVHAAQTQQALVAEPPVLAVRWPVYQSLLAEQTDFRSAAAIPLIYTGWAFAALNVYSTEETMSELPPLDLIQSAVGDPISRLLLGVISDLGSLGEWVETRLFDWLGIETGSATNLHRRLQVWTAVGMVMEAGGIDDHTALALLRAYAFGREVTLDEVALSIVRGRTTAQELIAGEPC